MFHLGQLHHVNKTTTQHTNAKENKQKMTSYRCKYTQSRSNGRSVCVCVCDPKKIRAMRCNKTQFSVSLFSMGVVGFRTMSRMHPLCVVRHTAPMPVCQFKKKKKMMMIFSIRWLHFVFFFVLPSLRRLHFARKCVTFFISRAKK